MTTKDQTLAIALFNTWTSRKRNWTDTLRAEAWDAFQEGYYQAPQNKPAPDCRTCSYLCDDGCGKNAPCTNGDQYQPAPAVVLWRTI